MMRPFVEGGLTVKPSDLNTPETALTAPAVGPNSVRNCAGVMKWPNSSDPGVLTAVAKDESPSGSRGASAIPSVRRLVAASLPSYRAPWGATAACPSGTRGERTRLVREREAAWVRGAAIAATAPPAATAPAQASTAVNTTAARCQPRPRPLRTALVGWRRARIGPAASTPRGQLAKRSDNRPSPSLVSRHRRREHPHRPSPDARAYSERGGVSGGVWSAA